MTTITPEPADDGTRNLVEIFGLIDEFITITSKRDAADVALTSAREQAEAAELERNRTRDKLAGKLHTLDGGVIREGKFVYCLHGMVHIIPCHANATGAFFTQMAE